MGVLERVGRDVEAFAKHGRRTAVNGSDVVLASRKHPMLYKHMQGLAAHAASQGSGGGGGKGRKAAASAAASKGGRHQATA